MSKNENLSKAKKAKNDEFYTQITDIEKELQHYKKHFKDKVVFCNCDDPTWSEFWRYFHLNFEELGLKKLISTHYDSKKTTYKLEYMGGDDGDIEIGTKTTLKQNGDFRSDECIELLKEADIVVTNPPFSIAREEYLPTLFKYEKKFIIIGDLNWITYKDTFPLLRDNKMWTGYNYVKSFRMPDGEFKKYGNKLWYTNLDIDKRHEDLILWKTYKGHEDEYPKYDNYDAINVDKLSDIPCDYEPCWYKCPHAKKCPYAISEGKEDNALCDQGKCNGEIGVPLTIIDKHSQDQFQIINADYELANPQPLEDKKVGKGRFYIKDEHTHTHTHTHSTRDFTAELSFERFRKCNGIIGVPITIFDKLNPEQFEILEGSNRYEIIDFWGRNKCIQDCHSHGNNINGKATYFRIHIRKKMQGDNRSTIDNIG